MSCTRGSVCPPASTGHGAGSSRHQDPESAGHLSSASCSPLITLWLPGSPVPLCHRRLAPRSTRGCSWARRRESMTPPLVRPWHGGSWPGSPTCLARFSPLPSNTRRLSCALSQLVTASCLAKEGHGPDPMPPWLCHLLCGLLLLCGHTSQAPGKASPHSAACSHLLVTRNSCPPRSPSSPATLFPPC